MTEHVIRKEVGSIADQCSMKIQVEAKKQASQFDYILRSIIEETMVEALHGFCHGVADECYKEF